MLCDGEIPFNIKREVSNEDTLAAMHEAEEMKSNPAAYKRYGTFSELLR